MDTQITLSEPKFLTFYEFIEKMGNRVYKISCTTFDDMPTFELKLRPVYNLCDDENISKRGKALIKIFNILGFVNELRTDKNIQALIDSYDAYRRDAHKYNIKRMQANIDKLLFESWPN